eukprot:PITA_31987
MDTRGLYLNRWTPDFDPEMDVPNAVPVWVHLPHLPLHCSGDESVRAIGNDVGKYIDRSEPKENMHACARICVEVDLGKGLPEAIKLKVDQCSKSKSLDSVNTVETSEEAWETVKRKNPNPPPRTSSKPPSESLIPSSQPSGAGPSSPLSINPFESLSTEDPLPLPPPRKALWKPPPLLGRAPPPQQLEES